MSWWESWRSIYIYIYIDNVDASLLPLNTWQYLLLVEDYSSMIKTSYWEFNNRIMQGNLLLFIRPILLEFNIFIDVSDKRLWEQQREKEGKNTKRKTTRERWWDPLSERRLVGFSISSKKRPLAFSILYWPQVRFALWISGRLYISLISERRSGLLPAVQLS